LERIPTSPWQLRLEFLTRAVPKSKIFKISAPIAVYVKEMISLLFID